MSRKETNIRAVLLLALTFVCLHITTTGAQDMPEHVVGENPYPFETVDPRVEASEPSSCPTALRPKSRY